MSVGGVLTFTGAVSNERYLQVQADLASNSTRQSTPTIGEVDLTYQITSTLPSVKYYYFGSQRVAMRQGNEVYYLHGDHLGSTSLTTNVTGTVVAETRHHPFGEVRWESGSSVTDFGFTGQRNEVGFGLMDYKARYYNPLLGRFISADSIIPDLVNSQGFNRYSYVLNNPLKFSDRSGHIPIDTIADIGFLVYDGYKIVTEGWTPENSAALAADVGALLIPYASGGGLAVRSGYAVARTAMHISTEAKMGIKLAQGFLKASQYSDEGLGGGSSNYSDFPYKNADTNGIEFGSSVSDDIVREHQQSFWEKFRTKFDPYTDEFFQLDDFSKTDWCFNCNDHAQFFNQKYGYTVRTIKQNDNLGGKVVVEGGTISTSGWHNLAIDDAGRVWDPATNSWGLNWGEYIQRFGNDFEKNFKYWDN